MKISKEGLLNYLYKTFNEYKSDHYNDHTFDYSQGYRKGIRDIIKAIKNYKEKK